MLTTKKKNYADAIMEGLNQTQSAIKAGYSAASAKHKGHQLSKDKDVLSYMERVNQELPPREPVEEVHEPEDTEKVPKLVAQKIIKDPLEVMTKIMNDSLFVDPKLALDAAAKLAPYVTNKVGKTGKKEDKNNAAKKATNSFTAMAAPQLVVNNTV